MSTHGKTSLNIQIKLVKLSYLYISSTLKLANMTGHSKESTQLDVYIYRKMARNHCIINLIRLPTLPREIPLPLKLLWITNITLISILSNIDFLFLHIPERILMIITRDSTSWKRKRTCSRLNVTIFAEKKWTFNNLYRL